MQLHIEVNGRVKTVDVEQKEGLYRVVIDGVERMVDAAAVDGTTFSLICLADGRSSQEVGLSPTGLPGETAVHMPTGVVSARVLTGAAGRFGRGGAVALAAGTQQVLAPMPGKVVKVLVKAGYWKVGLRCATSFFRRVGWPARFADALRNGTRRGPWL